LFGVCGGGLGEGDDSRVGCVPWRGLEAELRRYVLVGLFWHEGGEHADRNARGEIEFKKKTGCQLIASGLNGTDSKRRKRVRR